VIRRDIFCPRMPKQRNGPADLGPPDRPHEPPDTAMSNA
jgi:hypothetical protein